VPAQCRLLLGPRYALLRPEFAQYRETMVPRTGYIKRVLVYLGGSDNANNTGMVLTALSTASLAHLDVDVVIGPNFIHKRSLTEQANARHNTQIHGHRPHLADLMARTDLAVGAGGATTWERICMGLPSLLISIADNQLPACEALASSGLIQYLGSAHDLDVEAIESALLASLEAARPLHALALNNQSLVDGMGVNRVVETLYPSVSENLKIRPAVAGDALRFFAWVNDPEVEVRSSAINSAPIDIASHMDWFSRRLSDVNTHIYVLETDGLPVGQVRFEQQGLEAMIDYSLDFLARGRGWENHLIRLGIEALNIRQPTLLTNETKIRKIVPMALFVHTDEIALELDSKPQRSFSIAILSDRTSWINGWLPLMISRWLTAGHRVLWVHEIDALQAADFCFYLSFSKIVSASVRNKFRHNLVVHESDLPQGKGWSPLTWQILEGENRIPVTLIEAEDKVDSGVIYTQDWIEFEGHELIDELREAQARITIKICNHFIENYPDLLTAARAQAGKESFYSRRVPHDSIIDPDKSITALFKNLRVADYEQYPSYFVKYNQMFKICLEKYTK
jgi:hypothetical protein